MFKCVWRCYRFMKYMNSAEERSGSKMLQKVSLLGSQVPGLPLTVSLRAGLSAWLGLSFSACEVRVGPEEV